MRLFARHPVVPISWRQHWFRLGNSSFSKLHEEHLDRIMETFSFFQSPTVSDTVVELCYAVLSLSFDSLKTPTNTCCCAPRRCTTLRRRLETCNSNLWRSEPHCVWIKEQCGDAHPIPRSLDLRSPKVSRESNSCSWG